jgi:hypothetical protein
MSDAFSESRASLLRAKSSKRNINARRLLVGLCSHLSRGKFGGSSLHKLGRNLRKQNLKPQERFQVRIDLHLAKKLEAP